MARMTEASQQVFRVERSKRWLAPNFRELWAYRELLSFFIWRDARRRAPVRADALATGEGRGKPGSKPPPKPRKLSQAERRRRKRGRAKR